MTEEKLKKEAREYMIDHAILNADNEDVEQAYFDAAKPREEKIATLEAQIEKMSELINRYYMVCTEIPKELRTMTFDSCLEDTVKMVQDGVVRE